MRLLRVKQFTTRINKGLSVEFIHQGATGRLSVELPEKWDDWDHQQRIDWIHQQATSSLPDSLYIEGGVLMYPDLGVPEQAVTNLEELPGWASWSAKEAEQWVESNIVDLTSAKEMLKQMARIIVHLRDISMGR